jgi:rhamnogalacturonyl hydrolase YesR
MWETADMRFASRWLLAGILSAGLMLVAESRGAKSGGTTKVSPLISTNALGGVVSEEIRPAVVLAAMKKVADWQLANPSPRPALEWTQAAGYTGMMALGSISDDPKYHDAMMAMGRKHDWRPRDPAEATALMAKRAAETKREPKPVNYLYHADEHCVMQTYLELYLQHRDSKMLAPSKQRCDEILATPRDDDLDFTKPRAVEKWSWCDALFMSPPVWARLTAATGDRKYLEFMDRNWWLTSNYLYDKDEHLYFRDSTFFNKREANGRKVFWSRGNGWVMAGIVRVLQYLPKDHPSRVRYLQQYREMADKVLTCQQADGLWRASLLDPGSYPLKESSGSGFFTYAFAWGVNQGLLNRAKFYPSVANAWRALVDCVATDGRLTHVQPIGADPKKFDPESTEPYSVGAFLLAGSEVYRLAQTPGPIAAPR